MKIKGLVKISTHVFYNKNSVYIIQKCPENLSSKYGINGDELKEKCRRYNENAI